MGGAFCSLHISLDHVIIPVSYLRHPGQRKCSAWTLTHLFLNLVLLYNSEYLPVRIGCGGKERKDGSRKLLRDHFFQKTTIVTVTGKKFKVKREVLFACLFAGFQRAIGTPQILFAGASPSRCSEPPASGPSVLCLAEHIPKS